MDIRGTGAHPGVRGAPGGGEYLEPIRGTVLTEPGGGGTEADRRVEARLPRSGDRFDTMDELSRQALSIRIRSADDKPETLALVKETELSSQNALAAEFEFE